MYVGHSLHSPSIRNVVGLCKNLNRPITWQRHNAFNTADRNEEETVGLVGVFFSIQSVKCNIQQAPEMLSNVVLKFSININ